MENQITVADLALIKNLIEVSSSRGAFKADELSTVGQIYDKLSEFLNQIIKAAEKVEHLETSKSGDSND